MVWDSFIELEKVIADMMQKQCGDYWAEPNDQPVHTNKYFSNDKIDLAHISVIDMREEKKMWMMHVACYAKAEYCMPIYGFDVIVGKNKVTGCFHDMSPTTGESVAEQEFETLVTRFIPKRERDLPQWAKDIFSPNMVVAGATSDPDEIANLCRFGSLNLASWLREIGTKEVQSPEMIAKHKKAKAAYCSGQLQNTNSKNVMISLGLEESYVTRFKKIQFPY